MTATVSVIVPTFNRAKYIGATLRSVLAQSRPPFEVIVLDDGSTDDTAAVVAGFGSAVRYLRQDNAGVSAARNHGARLASGDIIAFVDSDDVWRPSKLEVQLLAMEQFRVDWSITGCDIIDLDDAVIPGREGFEAVFPVFRDTRTSAAALLGEYLAAGSVQAASGPATVLHGDAYDALFLGNFGLPSSAVLRRALFAHVGGFDPTFRLAEETEFFHRLAAAAPVAIAMAPLVGYRVGQSGSLTSPSNTATLVGNALRSGERAAALRPARSERATRNWHLGRQRLLRHLAYTHLSNFDSVRAREALHAAWAAGAAHDAWSLSVYAASLLPTPALRALHAAKRRSA